MISQKEYKGAQKRALKILKKAGSVLTKKEKENIEVADFGLGDIKKSGLEIITYVNTKRVCAKELILFPDQTCPEHFHPNINGELGKEETFRCRWGEVYLYAPGEKTKNPKARLPRNQEKYYTVFQEIILKPGEQYTIYPNTKHWFQGGPNGAVVSEFSTRSRDEKDIFTDPNIKRTTKMKAS